MAFLVISLSPRSPRGPCIFHHPRIIPVIPIAPEGPHVVPKAVVSVVSTHVVLVIPIIPMSFPHCLKGLQIISNPPDTHPTHLPPPGGVGCPKSLKM